METKLSKRKSLRAWESSWQKERDFCVKNGNEHHLSNFSPCQIPLKGSNKCKNEGDGWSLNPRAEVGWGAGGDHKPGTAKNSCKPSAEGTGQATGQPLRGQGTGRAQGPTKVSMRLPGDARGQPCRATSRTGTNMPQDAASESRKQTIRAKGRDKPPVIKVSTLLK